MESLYKCQMTEYNPPQDYPSDTIQRNGKLQTVQLSFEILNAEKQLCL